MIHGELDIEALRNMPDEEVCARLVRIDGVGVWTAEMLMIFSMQRQNVLSYGDLAILRGMRLVYHHRKITREMFGPMPPPSVTLRIRCKPVFLGRCRWRG